MLLIKIIVLKEEYLNNPKLFYISYDKTNSKILNSLLENDIKIMEESLSQINKQNIESNMDEINHIREIYSQIIHISSFNFSIDNSSDILIKSSLTPYILRKLLIILFGKIIKLIILFTSNSESKLFIELIFDNIYTIYNTFSIDNKSISDTIKKTRDQANTRRKNNFNRLSDEMKFTQKLYRKFNLGDLFGMEDKNLTAEDEFQGLDLATNERQPANMDDIDIGETEENDAMLLTNQGADCEFEEFDED